MTRNRYDPSPRNQHRQPTSPTFEDALKAAEQAAPAAELQPANGGAAAQPAVLAAPEASAFVTIALMEGAEVLASVDAAPRDFKTGSRGYGLYAKAIVGAESILMLRVGTTFTSLGAMRQFKTGSHGWNVSAKAEINGKRYQVGANVTAIDSKLNPGLVPTGNVRVQIGVNVIEIGSKSR